MKEKIFFFSTLDEQGVYYWHKRTGTVTRDRPESIINSPSLTLSTSSSNDTCFETNSLLYKSESDFSIRVKCLILEQKNKSIYPFFVL